MLKHMKDDIDVQFSGACFVAKLINIIRFHDLDILLGNSS